VAPRDGTTLLVAAPYIVLNQILTPSVKYKAEEFAWLGRIAPLTQVGFAWHTAGVTTVEQAKRKEIIFGAAGSGGPSTMAPWSLNRLAGTKFKVVRGYAGVADQFLALERGEILGMGSVSVNALTKRGWVADNKVKILYTIATERPAELPDTPTVVELVSGERNRAVMKLLTSIPDIGLTIIGTPGIPADRVAALREAFAKTVRTPDFVQFIGTLDVEVQPLSGAEVESMVREVASAPAEVVDALKAAIAPMN
jgi:tripartite-type tricarboxylate transporter receptor subunit TctC